MCIRDRSSRKGHYWDCTRGYLGCPRREGWKQLCRQWRPGVLLRQSQSVSYTHLRAHETSAHL
eukprot:11672014-Alexandrium_andersonii.AAC.1